MVHGKWYFSHAMLANHGSLEGVGMLKRHAVAHLDAELLKTPNLPSTSLEKSVFFLKISFLCGMRIYFFPPALRYLPSQ